MESADAVPMPLSEVLSALRSSLRERRTGLQSVHARARVTDVLSAADVVDLHERLELLWLEDTFAAEIAAVILAHAGPRSRNLADVVYDTTLAPRSRDVLIVALRAVAATLAVARAEELGTELAPWLARALADTLELVAGVDPWERSLADFEPHAEELVVNDWLVHTENGARTSGEPVHFPLRSPAR